MANHRCMISRSAGGSSFDVFKMVILVSTTKSQPKQTKRFKDKYTLVDQDQLTQTEFNRSEPLSKQFLFGESKLDLLKYNKIAS